MQLVRQGTVNGCGAACVAMLAGVTFAEGAELVGTARGTSTRKMVGALRSLGYACDDRLTRWYTEKQGSHPTEGLYLARVRWYLNGRTKSAKNSHWIIVCNGRVYDSIFGVLAKPYASLTTTGKVTSILKLMKEQPE